MTKRIVSGVFLLIALGALGLILAGALTSGEQLIVRFLTAIIVAALGLYVISDLRLQSEDGDIAAQAVKKKTGTKQRNKASLPPPPANSTAAFMATVTGKKSSTTAELDGDARTSQETNVAVAGQAEGVLEADSGAEPSAAASITLEDVSRTAPIDLAATAGDAGPTEGVEAGQSSGDVLSVDLTSKPITVPAIEEQPSERPMLVPVPTLEAATEQSPYSADDELAPLWPLTPDGKAVEAEVDEVEGNSLTTIFSRQSNEQLNGHQADGESETIASVSTLPTSQEAVPPEPADNEAVTKTSFPETTFPETAHIESAAVEESAEAVAAEDLGRQSVEIVVVENNSIVATGSGFISPEPIAPFTPPAPAVNSSDYSSAPLAEVLDVRLNNLDGSAVGADIEKAIRSGEVEVITSLMADGVLTKEGPLLDRDIRTMVYVAFTSNELRKILAAGGMPDGDYSDIDLGEIEVFRNQAVSTVSVPMAQLEASADPVGSDEKIDLDEIDERNTLDALSVVSSSQLSEGAIAELEELDLREAETASPAM